MDCFLLLSKYRLLIVLSYIFRRNIYPSLHSFRLNQNNFLSNPNYFVNLFFLDFQIIEYLGLSLRFNQNNFLKKSPNPINYLNSFRLKALKKNNEHLVILEGIYTVKNY